MSTQNPILVFSGSSFRAVELTAMATARGWLLLHETDMLQTLGQVVFFYPDIVIIEDADPEQAHEVFMHLHSVNAEPMLILTDNPETWDIARDTGATILRRDAATEHLAATITDILQTREQPELALGTA